MTLHWSTHQLTEYFSAISEPQDRAAAAQVAAERAAESLDAEIGGVVLDGVVAASVGLGSRIPPAGLFEAAAGAARATLPGLGTFYCTRAPLTRDRSDALVACRLAEPFTGEERNMLLGMAQVLGLALHSLDVLAAERALREEREREAEERLRLLDAVTTREHLLANLLDVQRAISARQPLQAVLDAITSGAAGLLDGSAVSLMLVDPFAPQNLVCASTSDGTRAQATSVDPQAVPALAAPVVVDGRPVGSLVAEPPATGTGSRPPQELRQTLSAFAQQVSLALSEARSLEAIEEAYHDPLTGLPTRRLFIRRLEQALAAGSQVNVLFVDLDRFKAVNDSLGHAAGDELLGAVATRLRGCLRGVDTAARLGGDEFAALLPDVPDGTAQAIAHRIIEALGRPFLISNRDVLIGASVGIARSREAETDAAELLAEADLAMYRAKKSGAGKVTVFEPVMQSEALDTLSLASDLQHAVAGGLLHLHYQPVVDLRTGRPFALEALVRWQHPERGAVPPAVFVPMAEQSGLIHELGRWVLRAALADAAAWQLDHPDVAVSVNVSARQIVDPAFGSEVSALLAQAGMAPDRLVLELTETALITHVDAALGGVRELKELGTRLAVDDFGTGYSSLSHLRRFPVDLLKIDGSFVRSMSTDPREEALVRAVLGLGRSLQIPTVAEGIETIAQLEMLRANDCDLGQGFLLGRPMPAGELAGYLAKGTVVGSSVAALTA